MIILILSYTLLRLTVTIVLALLKYGPNLAQDKCEGVFRILSLFIKRSAVEHTLIIIMVCKANKLKSSTNPEV